MRHDEWQCCEIMKIVAGLTWRLTKLVTMSLMMVRHYVVHSFWYFWGASRGTRLRVCWHTTSRTLPFKMDVLKQNPSTLDWPIVLNTLTWVFFLGRLNLGLKSFFETPFNVIDYFMHLWSRCWRHLVVTWRHLVVTWGVRSLTFAPLKSWRMAPPGGQAV